MAQNAPIIVWFRNDLRLTDNPALYNAAYSTTPILPVFIYDVDAMDRDYGAAQKWWLDKALHSLRDDFKKHDIDFLVRQGDSHEILNDLIKETGAKGVYWNRSYEKWSIDRDSKIKSDFENRELDVQSFKANVLFEPWTIKNGSGAPYRVFTPFFKECKNNHLDQIGDALPILNSMINATHSLNIGDISDFDFIPDIRWDQKMEDDWDISEDGAWTRMNNFFEEGLAHYKDGRNIPSKPYTSRLSPYLRWGMISPRSIWHETNMYAAAHDIADKDRDHFLSEVGWREFSFHLLYYNPEMKSDALQPRFKDFPWRESDKDMKAWQKGQTGYPMIDAGMRELWQTGWMHNRIRMIVGSLLVKHLLLPWQDGEAWFWDTLVDACPANNTAGWQWIGGCGADAAPYFRIFNPITQGDKFDAYDYVRKYIPELDKVDDKYLFSPWEAPVPPANYPSPIVEHKQGRERALSAFESTKS
jgi:deoxyribodipyrimidine photo-lyase